MMTKEEIAELRAEYKRWPHLKPYSDFKKCLDEIEQLKKSEHELEDNDRWMREVLNDFRIPFDDHKIGRRLAFTQWMFEHNR